jgi:RNA polymerase sigma-70 factor (ECF subfamily)
MDMMNMEAALDSELVFSLQAGSLEALGVLYDRHRRLVFRTALAITGDAEAAADLLHDVFLRLFRFAAHIDPHRPLEPWLYRMTTNLSYTWVKRRQRWCGREDIAIGWQA